MIKWILFILISLVFLAMAVSPAAQDWLDDQERKKDA